MRQSEIRLPERPLIAETLQPGDWIQIEAGVWRVKSQHSEAGLHRIDIEASDGRVQATLLASGNRWTFEQGTFILELPGDALVVFPAGSTEG
jgi:hypothetical protein